MAGICKDSLARLRMRRVDDAHSRHLEGTHTRKPLEAVAGAVFSCQSCLQAMRNFKPGYVPAL